MTTSLAESNNHWLGIGLVTSGVFLFSIQDVIVKQISGAYPVQEIVFIRSLVAMVFLLGMSRYSTGRWASLRSDRPGLLLLRGGVLLTSYTTYYLALAALPLAEVVAIYFVSPLITTLLSILILRESIAPRHVVALAIGFLGTLLIVRPGWGVWQPVSLLAIVAAFAYAVSVIITRRVSATEPGLRQAVYATATYALLPGFIGLVYHQGIGTATSNPSLDFLTRPWVMPTPYHLQLMIITGLIAAIGFYCLTEAYRVASATIVAPFEYVMLPFSILWGFLLWRELPSLLTIIGVILIITGGLQILPRRARRTRWLWTRR